MVKSNLSSCSGYLALRQWGHKLFKVKVPLFLDLIM